MKNMLRFLSFLLVIFAFATSCSQSELNEMESVQVGSEKSELAQTDIYYCQIGGPNLVCPSETARYRSLPADFTNPSFQWSVVSGNMSISGASTNMEVDVDFDSDFNGGELNVIVSEGGAICSEYYTINKKTDCSPDPSCNDNLDIVENTQACSNPSIQGEYQLTGYPQGSTITWSATNASIMLTSQADVIKVTPNSLTTKVTVTATVSNTSCPTEAYTETFFTLCPY